MRSLQLSIASDTLSAQGPKSMERPKALTADYISFMSYGVGQCFLLLPIFISSS